MTKKILLSAMFASMAVSYIFGQIGVNATGALPATGNMLEVLQASGTDGTNGIYVNHSGTAATGYALQAIKNGAGVNNIAAYFSATGGTGSNYALIIPNSSGNVGIGDITPASLFTVGNGDLFQINSSGVITTAAGITSSGTITFSGLSSTGIVHNSAAGLLSTSSIVNADIANATIDLAAKVTGVLPVANGGTATSTAFTQGSVVFAGASGVYSQNNSKLFWNNTNNSLGIGTAAPDVSASLDISTTSKGLLIPRVALASATDAATVPTPATGLLVFSTGGAIGDGFYYNSGTAGSPQWRIFNTAAPGGGYWATGTGNSNLTDGTDFMGTTNDRQVNFVVNGTKAGRIDKSTGLNTFLGYASGGSFNMTGSKNTGIGHQALNAVSSQTDNTAMGYQALLANTASQNTAVGSGALQANTTGVGNTAVGYASYTTNSGSGDYNTALGFQAGYYLTGSGAGGGGSGDDNTAVGAVALGRNVAPAGGNRNTALGRLAGWSGGEVDDNTSIGAYALYLNLKQGQNTALGSNALYNQTYSGAGANFNSDNVAIGYKALYNNNPSAASTAWKNTAVGTQSLYTNATGKQNTALGWKAAYTSNVDDVTALGYNALSANSAAQNTAVGSGALAANTSAAGNVALGYQALNLNQTNPNNTAIGYQSMLNNDNGLGGSGYNTAIGYQALLNCHTGGNNVAVGYQAMQNTGSVNYSGGANNTGIGFNVLTRNTTGNNNTTVGAQASWCNQTGSNNTAMGEEAGFGSYGVFNNSDNSLFGYKAGFTNQTGNQNTAVGSGALQLNSASSDITAVGFNALNANTAAQNTAMGSGALQANTTATGNTAMGYRALTAVVSQQTNNTAIGLNALSALGGAPDLNGASDNVAIGVNAFATATRMQQCVAIGSGAMQNTNTNQGSGDVAIGYLALTSGATGAGNIAIGSTTMQRNTGSNNTVIGGGGMLQKQAGDNNVAIGQNAGFGNCCNGATAIANNTFIGTNAAQGISAAGGTNNNIVIGYNAGFAGVSNLTTGSNNIILGYNVDPPVGTNNNQLTIGNLIYATGGFGTGTTVGTGNVGIKNNAPAQALDVTGNVKSSGIFFAPNGTAAAPPFSFTNDGGCGMYLNSVGGGAASSVMSFVVGGVGSGADRFTLANFNARLIQGASTSANPTALRITGGAHTNVSATQEMIDFELSINRTVTWNTGAIATQRFALVRQPTIAFNGASVVTDAAAVGIIGAPITSTNATLTNTHGLLISSGAVNGAGVATNSYGLTVNAQTGASNNYAAEFLGGNVGIGTASPAYLLHAQKSDASGNGTLVTVDNPANSDLGFAVYRMIVRTSGGSDVGSSLIASRSSTYQASNGIVQGLTLRTIDANANIGFSFANAANSCKMIILGTSGNVGIGTTAPASTLDVNGVANSATGFRVAGAATAGNYLRGNGTNFVSSAIAAGDLPGSFSGFANPSASIGLTTVNGASTTAMRSDAAPALSQAIVPTWTGTHTFTNGTYSALFTGGNVGIVTSTPASMFSVGASSEFQVNSTGNIVKLNNVATSFPASQGAASTFLKNDGAGNLSWTNGALLHTIFTPAEAGTVNLTNNTMNVINPAGALVALTVNFPGSPSDNDVVEIKFTQTVTTVTYGGGTVVDGVANPALGSFVKYVYDSATASWY